MGGGCSTGRPKAGGQSPSAEEDIPRDALRCHSLFRGRRDSSEGRETAAWPVALEGKDCVCVRACVCVGATFPQ